MFEGKSRPRMVLAIAGWFFVLLTGAVVVSSLIGHGPAGDVIIFGLFFIVILMIAAAETHGLWLMRKGTGSRRLLLTTQGVEVINPHRVAGIFSAEWEEVDRIEIDPGKRGGSYIQVFTPHAAKASIRVTSASRDVAPEQVRFEVDRLRGHSQQ